MSATRAYGPDLSRLPTLLAVSCLRRGQAMALSTHASELRDESAALRAEASLVQRRAVQLRRARAGHRTAAADA